jgi:hypothetical protein
MMKMSNQMNKEFLVAEARGEEVVEIIAPIYE